MKTQHENKDGNGKKQGMSPKIIEFFFVVFLLRKQGRE